MWLAPASEAAPHLVCTQRDKVAATEPAASEVKHKHADARWQQRQRQRVGLNPRPRVAVQDHHARPRLGTAVVSGQVVAGEHAKGEVQRGDVETHAAETREALCRNPCSFLSAAGSPARERKAPRVVDCQIVPPKLAAVELEARGQQLSQRVVRPRRPYDQVDERLGHEGAHFAGPLQSAREPPPAPAAAAVAVATAVAAVWWAAPYPCARSS